MNGTSTATVPTGSQTAGSARTADSDAKPPRDVTEYGTRRLLIVSGVMLAALLQTLDGTIVNVALPTIQGNLGASIDEATWVVTAYIISAVVIRASRSMARCPEATMSKSSGSCCVVSYWNSVSPARSTRPRCEWR